jgi:hypothetical protein
MRGPIVRAVTERLGGRVGGPRWSAELGSAPPRYAELGVALQKQVLEQFTEEDSRLLRSARLDLGDFLFRAGRHDEGLRVFEKIIRDFPVTAVGYVRLADVLAHGPSREAGPIDLDRAEELLRQARPLEDAKGFDVDRRLANLEKASGC